MRISNHDDRPSTKVAQTLAQAAARSDQAILVGNRAGIVEWANSAWTRITGFPLKETLSKPIIHFLDQASIDIELVDFVGQHYLEGRACTIEFPFETFDERTIWVHLEVQPLRNEEGDVADFVAFATDVSERRQQDLESDLRPTSPTKRDAPRSRPSTLARDPADDPVGDRVRLSLSAETRIACERAAHLLGPRTEFDVSLDPNLPSIHANRILLDETMRLILQAAGAEVDESWGSLTVMTGRTEVGRSHLSAAHPIPARLARLGEEAFLFLEVHDTSRTLTPEMLRAIDYAGNSFDHHADHTSGNTAGNTSDHVSEDQSGALPGEARTRALCDAARFARRLGGSLHVDSTPGCGTQALLLMPIS